MSPDQLDLVELAARERREADARYNEALTGLDAAIVAAARAAAPARADLERLTTALIIFLQQITAFVESKDRELSITTSARVDRIGAEVQSLTELRAQVAILTRATEMLKREPRTLEPSTVAPGTMPPGTLAPGPIFSDAYTYVAFEDRFRGSDHL